MKSVARSEIFIKKGKPKPSIAYNTYWRFAAERQAIFFKRLSGGQSPWTKDPILRLFKFTNAYRITDRVSQYLVSEVIYKGDQNPEEVLFRILLFKMFNKIETWKLLVKHLGSVSYRDYNFSKYDAILASAKRKGNSIYSGAYIMASGKEAFGYPLKHQNHLKLIEYMLKDGLHSRVNSLSRMEDLYISLLAYPTIGTFLAYQLATDINYSNLSNFTEGEFVKAGPGAKDGIRKCFLDIAGYSEEDIIKMMVDHQELEFERLGINFQKLWGRSLQLIDCQNIFCEVDKYSRIAHPEIAGISGRTRIKQKFTPISLTPIEYFFPPKWNIKVT